MHNLKSFVRTGGNAGSKRWWVWTQKRTLFICLSVVEEDLPWKALIVELERSFVALNDIERLQLCEPELKCTRGSAVLHIESKLGLDLLQRWLLLVRWKVDIKLRIFERLFWLKASMIDGSSNNDCFAARKWPLWSWCKLLFAFFKTQIWTDRTTAHRMKGVMKNVSQISK